MPDVPLPVLWRRRALTNLRAARLLLDRGLFAPCVGRAYYAAYQALTALCVERGDTFANGWNNPSHDQLPDLVLNNGDLSIGSRRLIVRQLRFLRTTREHADYRPGLTIDKETATQALRYTAGILNLLAVREEDT